MLRMLRLMLRALGVQDHHLEIQVEEEQQNVYVPQPNLVGRQAVAVVEHAEWNGEMQAKVRKLLPLQDVGVGS